MFFIISEILKLNDNLIRLKSGINLARSLGFNKTLTYLDLSSNSLGKNGGEALGMYEYMNGCMIIYEYLHIKIDLSVLKEKKGGRQQITKHVYISMYICTNMCLCVLLSAYTSTDIYMCTNMRTQIHPYA